MIHNCNEEEQRNIAGMAVGDFVMYTDVPDSMQVNWGGHDHPDKSEMKVGEIYEISDVEIHDSYTHVMFKGISGKFNHISFTVVDPTETLTVIEMRNHIQQRVKLYSSIPETQEHIGKVREYLQKVIEELYKRIVQHDKSKTQFPELDTFDEYTPKLKEMVYGSDEYKNCLAAMKPALEHHYLENRHHPEHFINGIHGMNLIDLLEMFCDWLAATKRHTNGNIYKSIEINAGRFEYDELLKDILKNTADFFKETGNKKNG
jgi:hypothetical protein